MDESDQNRAILNMLHHLILAVQAAIGGEISMADFMRSSEILFNKYTEFKLKEKSPFLRNKPGS